MVVLQFASSTAPDSRRPVDGGFAPRSASPWSWYLPRSGLIDADARHTDCVQLFAVLRQIRSISRLVSRLVLQSLIVSLVLTRLLDYGSATLAGLPAHLLDRMQSVLNAAAWLVYGSRKYDHVTPLLKDLHWLHIAERIAFQLAVPVYRCQHGIASPNLANELHRVAADVESRQFSCHYGAGRAKYSTLNDRRPFLSCSSPSSLEQSSAACDIITVADSFSAASQDGTVYPVIWLKLVLTFCNLCFKHVVYVVSLLTVSIPYI